jgi:Cft2 family RNA processing exonuclease
MTVKGETVETNLQLSFLGAAGTVTWWPAGHILGSTWLQIETADSSGGKSIVLEETPIERG